MTEVLHDVGDRIAPGEPLAAWTATTASAWNSGRRRLSATLAEIGRHTARESGLG